MIDILKLKFGKNSYLKFYVKDNYIYCENIKTNECVVVGIIESECE